MKTEVWKDIVGYEGLYQVSNYGVIRRLDSYVRCKYGKFKFNKGRILKYGSRSGYLTVNLCKDGIKKTIQVHRITAIMFINTHLNINNLHVNHIDGNKINNCIWNLEWCTPKENTLHYHRVLGGGVHNKRQVVQLDKHLKIIDLFNSITDAAKYVKGNASNIYRCCVGEQSTSYGYVWRFK